jgi:hypothetical protein
VATANAGQNASGQSPLQHPLGPKKSTFSLSKK